MKLDKKSNAYRYIRDAVFRIESKRIPDSSHLTGIYGKAAQFLEHEVREKIKEILSYCNIDYNTMVKPHLKDKPKLTNLTLGQSAYCLDYLNENFPKLIKGCLLSCNNIKALIERILEINRVWVDIKHYGKEISSDKAIELLNKMLDCLDTI